MRLQYYQILNPLRVDRSVENDPLPFLCCGRGHVPERAAQDAVRPLVSVRIEDAVKLGHRDRLRVDDLVVRSVFLAGSIRFTITIIFSLQSLVFLIGSMLPFYLCWTLYKTQITVLT